MTSVSSVEAPGSDPHDSRAADDEADTALYDGCVVHDEDICDVPDTPGTEVVEDGGTRPVDTPTAASQPQLGTRAAELSADIVDRWVNACAVHNGTVGMISLIRTLTAG